MTIYNINKFNINNLKDIEKEYIITYISNKIRIMIYAS